MKEFNHPHVLPLIGVCLDNGPGVSMVMPYMINGSLLDYLKQERSNLVILDNDPDKVNLLFYKKNLRAVIIYTVVHGKTSELSHVYLCY